MIIDSWVMSCRVLGRNVEDFIVGEIARRARDAGCTRIVGRYIPTKKNALVADLYLRMGFAPAGQADATQLSVLELETYRPARHHIANGLQDKQETA
jgi:predicted enzyme involved in methoxymalonyl-ACP biosynthesis